MKNYNAIIKIEGSLLNQDFPMKLDSLKSWAVDHTPIPNLKTENIEVTKCDLVKEEEFSETYYIEYDVID